MASSSLIPPQLWKIDLSDFCTAFGIWFADLVRKAYQESIPSAIIQTQLTLTRKQYRVARQCIAKRALPLREAYAERKPCPPDPVKQLERI